MQKVNKVKRFITMTAMAAMLSITGLGAAQNSAQANTKDRSWSFNLTIGSEYKFISKEKKETSCKRRNETDDSYVKRSIE